MLLALESSSLAASAALLHEGQLLGEHYLNHGLTHSQTLLPLCHQLLENAQVSPRQLEAVAVSVGPGSFTGLRIGVAAAKGLAMGLGVGCVPVSTLEALAYNLMGLVPLACPVLDARRGQVYTALFAWRQGALQRLWPDAALSLEELGRQLPAGACLVGDGAALCYEALCGRVQGLCLAPAHLRYQRAAGVALAAAGKAPQPADGLAPSYLRRPQAERERLARLAAAAQPPPPGPPVADL